METQAPITELVSHADFLRRLATHLVRNPHDAEDAVQDAFVAAIERPPTLSGSPRAWLTAVVKNRVRMTKRSEGRRNVREGAAARPEAGVSSIDAAASVETASRLVEEVSALDEPHRTVVVLRYYHDLRFAEIAERVGRPVATIRTQHHRALAQLRERLDRRWGGRRRAWVVALLPLARSHAAPRGVLALLTAAVLVVLCAIPFFVGRGDPIPPARSTASPDPTPPVAAVAAAGDRVVAETSGAPRTGTAADVLPSDDEAVVRFADASGRPVAGVRVALLRSPLSLDSYVPVEVVAEAVSDEAGRVRFDIEPFIQYAVKAVHPDYAVAGDLFCYGGVVTDFQMQEPAVLTGVVRDAESELPVSGATVYAMDWGVPGVIHEWYVTTDEAGRYRIVGLGKGYYNLRAWAAGTQDACPSRPMHMKPGKEHVLDFDLVRSPPLVLTVVDGASGHPLPEVTVKWMQHPPITGPGEALAILPISAAWRTSLLVSAPGWLVRSVQVPVEALRTPEKPFVVRMSRCIPVTGRVENSAGTPLSGVTVRFIVRGKEDRELLLQEIQTAEDGTFRSECGLPGGSVRLEVHATRKTVLVDVTHPVPPDATELRLGPIVAPETATLTGRVVDPDGEPVSSGVVRVGMRNPEGYQPWTEVHVDPRGRFRLPGVPRGEREIVLADVEGCPVQVRREDVRGDLRLDWRIPVGQVITGRILDDEGRPVPREYVVLNPGSALVRADDDGRFRFRALPAGNYRLTFRQHLRVPALEVPGNTWNVELRLSLP